MDNKIGDQDFFSITLKGEKEEEEEEEEDGDRQSKREGEQEEKRRNSRRHKNCYKLYKMNPWSGSRHVKRE